MGVLEALARVVDASGSPTRLRSRELGATKTIGRALWQIVVADVSMSLDNVLAVAGAAMDHPAIMAAGLAISVLLMGSAAAAVARLLERYRWLAYVGLAVILYVAAKMIWHGAHDMAAATPMP